MLVTYCSGLQDSCLMPLNTKSLCSNWIPFVFHLIISNIFILLSLFSNSFSTNQSLSSLLYKTTFFFITALPSLLINSLFLYSHIILQLSYSLPSHILRLLTILILHLPNFPIYYTIRILNEDGDVQVLKSIAIPLAQHATPSGLNCPFSSDL